VFAPLAVVSFVLIWVIGSWSLRPLARASRQAAAIGPTNPSGRVSTDMLPHEIRPMIDAVNGALARLDDAYAAQRRFTADAAHELRTPLAVLNLRLQRAKLDAAVDWPAMEWDLAHMNRTVGQLMELARKEDPAWLDGSMGTRPMNLSRVVREATAAVLPFAEENGRPLEVDPPGVVPALGRPEDLRDAVRNLLENALVHGTGAIRVRVRQESDGADRRAVIEVSDEGPGIAEELREEVFERFRKAKPNSPGVGLGLAIVRQVARVHGGEARVRPGPGCRVEISLPARGRRLGVALAGRSCLAAARSRRPGNGFSRRCRIASARVRCLAISPPAAELREKVDVVLADGR
jgi:two-component system, OmpR family, sensor histidine kinase TctE